MKKENVEQSITVLITVYNRQFNIDRQVSFWQNEGIKIIIIDSTKEARSDLNFVSPLIEYQHHPEGTFYEILYSVLDKVNTPYVIQVNDDDFVFASSLKNGVRFLEENNDFVSYQGSFMKFDENGKQTQPFYCCRGMHNFQKIKNDQASLERRMDLMQKTFVSPNHALFRTDCLKSAYALVKDEPKIQSIKYFDWIIGLVCTAKGKFHLDKELFHLRSEERLITDLGNAEYPAYLQREKRLTDLLANEEAIGVLANFIIEKGIERNLMSDQTKKLIKEKLNLYLKMHHSGGFLYRLKWKIACLPFLLYNQGQINGRFQNQVSKTMKLIRK